MEKDLLNFDKMRMYCPIHEVKCTIQGFNSEYELILTCIDCLDFSYKNKDLLSLDEIRDKKINRIIESNNK